jgi:hypothetical protein
MKYNFWVTMPLVCALFVPVAVAQSDATVKFIERLEKRRDAIQVRIDKATASLVTLDSIKSVSDELKAEGTSEQEMVLKEKTALESRVKSELKETEKDMKSSDKELVKTTSERQKEINTQYRAEIKELQKRFKEADNKLVKAEGMVSETWQEKHLTATLNLKESQTSLKEIEKQIEDRRNGKVPGEKKRKLLFFKSDD